MKLSATCCSTINCANILVAGCAMQELEYIMQIMGLFDCALSYIFRFQRHLIESWFPPLNFLWLQVMGEGHVWLCMDRGRSNHSCMFYALCYIMDCFESLLIVLRDEGECNRNNNSLVKKSFNIIHNFSLFQSEVGLERDHHGIVFSTHQKRVLLDWHCCRWR